jgi:hypothetical protein
MACSPKHPDLIAASALVLFPIVFIYFQLDLRALDLPPVYSGDTPWMFLSMKNILQFGSSTTNPTLGFPFGSDAALEPIYPTDTVLLARLLSLVTIDPIAASSLLVYLTHIVNAAIAFACFRILRLGRVMSLIAAMSFAFLEFGINPGRVYGGQPLILFAPLAVAGTLSLVPFRYARPWPAWLLVASCIGAFTVGLAHPYYVAFSAMVILISAVLLLAGNRIADIFFPMGMLLIIAIVMTAAWFGPILLADNIAPYSGPDRFWDAQSFLGLRIPDMIIPQRSVSTWLQNVSNAYYAVSGVKGANDSYLGTIGIFGAIVAIVLALRVRLLRDPSVQESETVRAASLLALFCLAFGITNGLGLLFSMTLTAMLRAQDRIIPLLAFYCIYIGLYSVETWIRIMASAQARFAAAGLVLVVALLGLLDQTSGPMYAALQSEMAPLYKSDRQFYTELEKALPVNSAVLELPPMHQFEDATYMALGLDAYDELRGPTYTNGLRWSFGLSSHNEGYLSQLDKDARQTLAQAIVRGFGAVLILKQGYADRGAALTEQIAHLLNRKPLIETSRYVAFKLPSQRAENSHHQQVVALWRGLNEGEYINGHRSRRDNSVDGTVTIFVSNQKNQPAKLRLAGLLIPALGGHYPGTFSVDDNSESFTAAQPGVDVSREILLGPGRHRITIHVEMPVRRPMLVAPPGLHFRLVDASITDISEIEAVAVVASALGREPEAAAAGP